ncbi:unnamed protein product [Oppiella nova]|uniref:AFP-like domain-containing protein n=1 Tax=Oppiella nova TaxID=334625 RepID=A0A7R9QGJ0_9ACAR|nr:unnamed protein product [Oppiella nova]CAG2165475.1 unnamed protein product [Oppiella nova]
MFELFGGTGRVGAGEECLVVAECGQNHNGDVNIAMKMISESKHTIHANCVKFQKSDLKSKFNVKALRRPYDSINSWGPTYGEHKRFLELTDEQFLYLKDYAKNEDILFTASAMDSKSLEFLAQIDVPFIKIGSGDVDNYPMLEKAAKYDKPLFVSTGMHDLEVVKTVYNLITPINKRLCLLHCVSAYPTPFEDINLQVITDYKNLFPSAVIGYSGHELGTEVSVGAVALGAKVLERHLTLDKTMKGTDHSCSLEPQEFAQMVTQIRNLEASTRDEQFLYLKDYAKNEDILFTASAMDSKSLEFLALIDVPFIKIGSGDVDNYPMLEKAAKYDKPLFVSTGMHDLGVVKTVYNLITPINKRLCLLHCVSAYPTPFQDINLQVITDYKNLFPSAVIGYSGHELGTEVSVGAVALGAKVLERHLTLDKTMKGTDHSCSLEPQEFAQMVTQIRNLELALTPHRPKNLELALTPHRPKCRQESEWSCYRKLGKSIVAKQFLSKGTVLSLDLIDIKVAEPFGINASKVFDILGLRVNKDIGFDESIQFDDLCQTD